MGLAKHYYYDGKYPKEAAVRGFFGIPTKVSKLKQQQQLLIKPVKKSKKVSVKDIIKGLGW